MTNSPRPHYSARNADKDTAQNIRRVMHAEVHPGKGDERAQREGEDASHPPRFAEGQ